jgi:energy-coupling factor transporter ATP-binding protein EcfA2
MLHGETQRGRTVLITTHLVAEWNGVADRCLLCREGAIERELDPMDLPHDFDALPTGATPWRGPRTVFGGTPKTIVNGNGSEPLAEPRALPNIRT